MLLTVGVSGCDPDPQASNAPDNRSPYQDAGQGIEYPEEPLCSADESPLESGPGSCGSWRHSVADVSRSRVPEILPWGWPDEQDDVRSMRDITLTIAPPPNDPVACVGDRCLEECEPTGTLQLHDPFARPLRRDLEPFYYEFFRSPEDYCKAAALSHFPGVFERQCYDTHMDEEDLDQCLHSIWGDPGLDNGRVHQEAQRMTAAALECIDRIRIVGPPRERLRAQSQLPVGHIEVGQLSSNRCDAEPDARCEAVGPVRLEFIDIENFSDPRTGAPFQLARDGEECLEVNQPWLAGGEACFQCLVDGQRPEPLDGQIPTYRVPAIMEISHRMGHPPCNVDGHIAAWRTELAACASGTPIKFFEPNGAASQRAHTPGSWRVFDGGMRELDIADLFPGERFARYWAFQSDESFGPTELELVRMADCLAFAYAQHYLTWKFDDDGDRRCDGVVCPEIVSPTGEDGLSDLVFSPYTSHIAFKLVVAGVTDPAAAEVSAESLPDPGGAVVPLVEEPFVEAGSGHTVWSVEYPRMPASYSGFGTKMLEVCVPERLAPGCCQGCDSVCVQQDIDLFWPVTLNEGLGSWPLLSDSDYARNRPGDDLTLLPEHELHRFFAFGEEMSLGARRAPNWFYYWLTLELGDFGLELARIQPRYAVFLPALAGLPAVIMDLHYALFATSAFFVESIGLPNNFVYFSDLVLARVEQDEGVFVDGVRAFHLNVVHEDCHVRQFLRWSTANRQQHLSPGDPSRRPVMAGMPLHPRDWSWGVSVGNESHTTFHDVDGDGWYTLGLECDLNGDGVIGAISEQDIVLGSLCGGVPVEDRDFDGDGEWNTPVYEFDVESLDLDSDNLHNRDDVPLALTVETECDLIESDVYTECLVDPTCRLNATQDADWSWLGEN